ncbi:unnamed protein product, partial [Gulo gulo]
MCGRSPAATSPRARGCAPTGARSPAVCTRATWSEVPAATRRRTWTLWSWSSMTGTPATSPSPTSGCCLPTSKSSALSLRPRCWCPAAVGGPRKLPLRSPHPARPLPRACPPRCTMAPKPRRPPGRSPSAKTKPVPKGGQGTPAGKHLG